MDVKIRHIGQKPQLVDESTFCEELIVLFRSDTLSKKQKSKLMQLNAKVLSQIPDRKAVYAVYKDVMKNG